jgi:predicted RNase H-like nuclease (RuvC/YqgF family)
MPRDHDSPGNHPAERHASALHDQLVKFKDQLETIEADRLKLAIQLRKCEAHVQDVERELKSTDINLESRRSLQQDLNQALKDQDALRTQIRKQNEESERLSRLIEAGASKLVAGKALAADSKNLRVSKLQIDVFFATLVIAAGLAIVTWFASHNIVAIVVVLAIVIVAGNLVSWAIKRTIRA